MSREPKQENQLFFFFRIAAKLNLPLGTVKTRMRQGMRKLQTLLREQL